MDFDSLTQDEKQQYTRGRCNFLALILTSFAAVITGSYASGYCNFAAREVKFEPDFDLESTCDSLNYTTPAEKQICNTLFTKHGVGLYGWYGTIPVDKQVCFSYTLFNPNVGYISPDFDAAFESAKVFSVMADVFGFIGWFSCAFTSCCPVDQARLKGLSCYFLLASICQALSFLIFASDVCEKDFFAQYFPNLDVEDAVASVECSLDRGSSNALSATILYFVCSLLAPVSIAPPPLGYQRAQRDEMAAAAVAGGGGGGGGGEAKAEAPASSDPGV